MFKRVDRKTDLKSYFYINLEDKEYGLYLNENDSKNMSDKEKKSIIDSNMERIKNFERR